MPTRYSKSQSPPRPAEPVVSIELAISAPVAAASALTNALPAWPSATLQP